MATTSPPGISFTRNRDNKDFRFPQLARGLHTGVVLGNLLPNQLVAVMPDGHVKSINCVWAAGIMSGLLGFKTSYIPPSKTRVLFFYTGEDISYILGSYSNSIPPSGVARGATDHTGPKVGDLHTNADNRSKSSRMFTEGAPPTDMVEGEFDISNLMGVGITLLRNLASLQGGDLARVECLLLDDMVRIISNNYRHHSGFGDFKIVNDGGRLNVEWHGTSLDHEAWGVRNPGDAKIVSNTDANSVNMTNGINGYVDDGRWRFSQYVGWLGDFINIFVTDPVNVIGELAADQLRSGKARLHINNDGAVLVQSVADIVLEKVVRIPVPIRLRKEEDPVGNRSDEGARNLEQLAQWKPSDSGNIFEMAFQLREYARWLNNTHSLSRFRQLTRDFKVPSEADVPVPDPNSAEQDKRQTNAGIANNRIVYSCIRIYRDGSIQTVDAYGNSFTSTKTGIQISSTKDILIQAAGSINLVAGKDVNVLAQQNVGITAVKDTLRLKAKNGIWLLIESGKCIIDFVAAGVTYLKNSVLNVDNKVVTSTNGSMDVAGQLTAVQVLAASSQAEDDHMGHLFVGIPSPGTESSQFQFQSDYGNNPLYQTEAQAALSRNEQPSSGSWDFAGNEVGGKGSPWPGSGKQEKKTTGGQSLATPQTAVPPANPKSMTSAPITLKVQT